MQKTHTILTGLALSALAPIAAAHGGHDHSHWMSQPIHAFSVAAVLAVVGVGVALYTRRARAIKTRK